MDERRIKRFFHGLRHTVLHPQWLVFRRDTSIRRWLAEQANGRVLDVGCADAQMRQYLSSSSEYVGLDYPSTAVGWYGTRPQVFGDAASLPFSHDCFDAVMLLDVLEHLPDLTLALNEAHRVLKPGGRLIVKVPCLYPVHDAPLDFRRWTEFGLGRDLSLHRFAVTDLRGFGTPLETSMLLANLGHAKFALAGLRERRLLAIVGALILPLMTPLRNVVGWLSSHASQDVRTMPYALCAVAVKR
jgi:SAM-dependent methyltransferase